MALSVRTRYPTALAVVPFLVSAVSFYTSYPRLATLPQGEGDKFDLGVRTSGEVVCKGEWRDDVLNGLAVKEAWLVDDDDRRVSHTLAGRFKQEGKKRDSTTLGVCRERIGKREMAVDAGEFKVRRVHTHTHSVPHAMCFKDFVFLLPPPSCCPCT